MKGTLEKLVGQEVSVRTIDGSENVVTIKMVNDDSFVVTLSDFTSAVIPFSSVALVSFR